MTENRVNQELSAEKKTKAKQESIQTKYRPNQETNKVISLIKPVWWVFPIYEVTLYHHSTGPCFSAQTSRATLVCKNLQKTEELPDSHHQCLLALLL